MTSSEIVRYRPMDEVEEKAVSDLAQKSFAKHIASHYSSKGVEEFLKISAIDSIKFRRSAGNIFIVCEVHDELIGMMELRSPAHIGLLFVDSDYAGRGIGVGFVAVAKEYAAGKSDIMTVNASPNSVGFYKKCGFNPNGDKREDNGIIYIPMEMVLPRIPE